MRIKISEEANYRLRRTALVIVISLLIVYVPYLVGLLLNTFIPFKDTYFFAHWIHGGAIGGLTLLVVAFIVMIVVKIARFIWYGED